MGHRDVARVSSAAAVRRGQSGKNRFISEAGVGERAARWRGGGLISPGSQDAACHHGGEGGAPDGASISANESAAWLWRVFSDRSELLRPISLNGHLSSHSNFFCFTCDSSDAADKEGQPAGLREASFKRYAIVSALDKDRPRFPFRQLTIVLY